MTESSETTEFSSLALGVPLDDIFGVAIGVGAHAERGDIVLGDNLLTIHPDGTVDGRIENMGAAAAVFVEFVRAHLNAIRADAWNEGYEKGVSDQGIDEREPSITGEPNTFNPYIPGTWIHNAWEAAHTADRSE